MDHLLLLDLVDQGEAVLVEVKLLELLEQQIQEVVVEVLPHLAIQLVLVADQEALEL